MGIGVITITLVLVTSGAPIERVTVGLDAIPSVHEFVAIGGVLYRVEDITHHVESKEIEVRAVA